MTYTAVRFLFVQL